MAQKDVQISRFPFTAVKSAVISVPDPKHPMSAQFVRSVKIDLNVLHKNVKSIFTFVRLVRFLKFVKLKIVEGY